MIAKNTVNTVVSGSLVSMLLIKLGRTQHRKIIKIGSKRVFTTWSIISILDSLSENISPSRSESISIDGLRKYSHPTANIFPTVISKNSEIVTGFRIIFIIQSVRYFRLRTLFKNIETRGNHFYQFPTIHMLIMQPNFFIFIICNGKKAYYCYSFISSPLLFLYNRSIRLISRCKISFPSSVIR